MSVGDDFARGGDGDGDCAQPSTNTRHEAVTAVCLLSLLSRAQYIIDTNARIEEGFTPSLCVKSTMVGGAAGPDPPGSA